MSELSDRRAIVLVVDGWSAGFLGPYGNAWLDTPACNRLASSGMVMEHVLADAPTVDAFYHGVWGERHAAFPGSHSRLPLAAALGEELSSQLLTDAPDVAGHPLADAFDRAEVMPGVETDHSAETAGQTHLARLFASAFSMLKGGSANLLWIHSNGMNSEWDAPNDFREQFRGDDDPPLPTEIVPPKGVVPDDLDPDVIQGWIWAYAGQVALLDHCLDAFLESWHQIREPALLIVMGARGYGLAEHGWWGSDASVLHSEHLHVPLMVTSNVLELAHTRCRQLVQPRSLYQTILDWFDPESPRENQPLSLLSLPDEDLATESRRWHPLAVARHADEWAIRTPAWHACLSTSPNRSSPSSTGLDGVLPPPPPLLYLKPDDRWEVNNVADRCQAVMEECVRLTKRIEQLPADSTLADVMPLSTDLLVPPG